MAFPIHTNTLVLFPQVNVSDIRETAESLLALLLLQAGQFHIIRERVTQLRKGLSCPPGEQWWLLDEELGSRNMLIQVTLMFHV